MAVMVKDIVCGKDVDKEAMGRAVGHVAAGTREVDPATGTRGFYDGTWYYFCSMKCRLQFIATPDDVISNAKSVGWL
jgi:YHS domain-containing protein